MLLTICGTCNTFLTRVLTAGLQTLRCIESIRVTSKSKPAVRAETGTETCGPGEAVVSIFGCGIGFVDCLCGNRRWRQDVEHALLPCVRNLQRNNEFCVVLDGNNWKVPVREKEKVRTPRGGVLPQPLTLKGSEVVGFRVRLVQ